MTLRENEVLRLRPARDSDCRLFWEWANDPVVRRSAFERSPIPWSEHETWFAGALASPSICIYVVSDAAEVPLGQVRFDLQPGGEAIVDVSLAAEARGRGIGAQALRLAGDEFRRAHPVTLVAQIRRDNRRSIGAFQQAGYAHRGEGIVRGYPTVIMQWPADRASVIR